MAVGHSRLSRPFLGFRLGGFISSAGVGMMGFGLVITGQLPAIGVDVRVVAGMWLFLALGAVALFRKAIRLGFSWKTVRPLSIGLSVGGGALLLAATLWIGARA